MKLFRRYLRRWRWLNSISWRRKSCPGTLFDESIPERYADYYRELDEATVKVDPQERHVSDFDWIVGQHHMEDGLIYKTTRVVVRKGLIVGFRALITAGRQQIEDKTPC